MHPFLHRAPDIASPTAIVFDLDPGAGADIRQCIGVAFLVKGVIEQLDSRDRVKGENAWALENVGSAIKPISAKKHDQSALTGRTMAQIAEASDATWHSNRTSVPGVDLDKVPRSEMQFVEPMLAKAVPDLPEGSDWQYEIKLDGYRALAINDKGSVRLLSRRNNVLNGNFRSMVDALKQLEHGLILDGEVVALDAEGRPSFNLLQHHSDHADAVVFYIFDVLAFTKFRVGRAFIVGDAGHIHSPAGGQGMNTGIGDAINLGWKLAHVLQDRADPSLLDSYEPERIGFARSLVLSHLWCSQWPLASI